MFEDECADLFLTKIDRCGWRRNVCLMARYPSIFARISLFKDLSLNLKNKQRTAGIYYLVHISLLNLISLYRRILMRVSNSIVTAHLIYSNYKLPQVLAP